MVLLLMVKFLFIKVENCMGWVRLEYLYLVLIRFFLKWFGIFKLIDILFLVLVILEKIWFDVFLLVSFMIYIKVFGVVFLIEFIVCIDKLILIEVE